MRALIDQGMPALAALRKVGLLPPKMSRDAFVVDANHAADDAGGGREWRRPDDAGESGHGGPWIGD